MVEETQADLLKRILENLRTPEQLDNHPWRDALFFKEYLAGTDNLDQSRPGQLLALAVGRIFVEMMPNSAPRRGKRLDTSWGKFGLLAAQYFAPLVFGLPYPGSLREAWGQIDHAILLFKFGKDYKQNIPETEYGSYRLVGDEPAVAPVSTLSDWHVKGIEKLAGLINDRERHLRLQPLDVKPELTESLSEPVKRVTRKPNHFRRWFGWVLTTILVVALIYLAGRVWSVYQLALLVRADAGRLEQFASSPYTLEKIKAAGEPLGRFRQDLERLRVEAAPFLKLSGPWLGQIPVYGRDLAAAPDLLEFASKTTTAVESAYQAGLPLLDMAMNTNGAIQPDKLLPLLTAAQPKFQAAREELQAAMSLRAELRGQNLSPRAQAQLQRLDPLISLLDDCLALGTALPDLLGAGGNGPRTYMLLVQNNDEIRPTGGFITSVGTFVVRNGGVFGLQFEEAGDMEDWSLPYPDAPWQLVQYMNSQVLVLRDANWFSSYPTAVEWVEYLYAYTHKHSVDGVIAIDQQMLVSILKVTGPVSLEGVTTPVTSDNVIDYMRKSKVKPPNAPPDWYRKAFISQIATALSTRLSSGSGVDWKKLAQVMFESLRERHLMVRFHDPRVTGLLEKWDLDGAIRPGSGDFLMALDTNVGFNKTNTVVESRMSYDVDLTDLAHPTGKLVISHTNSSDSAISCIQMDPNHLEERYPIHQCYWNYLRVYVPAGADLKDASPHAVPADWMLLGYGVPARVDTLDEGIDGVQGYGTLMVVPGGQTYNTGFDFFLPAGITQFDQISGMRTYSIKIKKQPGTLGVPISLRLHLPTSARIIQTPAGSVVNGGNILIETRLTTDVIYTIIFSAP